MPGTKFYGMTPLIMNATQKDDCAEVCELLLDAGADIQATDAAGKTARDWAKAGRLGNGAPQSQRHSLHEIGARSRGSRPLLGTT